MTTRYRIGFDIGGTFTDFILLDTERHEIRLHKCLTTPHDPSVGALEGLTELLSAAGLSFADIGDAVHGTTLVTNTLIERTGARLGLITTRGFRDILEMGTEQRYDIYDLFLQFPEPLVPRRHRLEVNERLDRDGNVLTPLDPAEVRATALRLRWRLFSAGGLCFLLAMLDEVLLPSPAKAPIDEMFRSPGAAWLMLAFGVTLAPFFEEIFFRGFLLPTLATAWDWSIEQGTGKPAPPLDEHGHPHWSIFAMVASAIFTSVPFAALHADQQGYALGPFVLLFAISLLLCAVRLLTRSLAASVLVHASYNFLLFAFMFLGTGGFRHLDKM
jgi:membrane protease YdiL (CAAX protease family)